MINIPFPLNLTTLLNFPLHGILFSINLKQGAKIELEFSRKQKVNGHNSLRTYIKNSQKLQNHLGDIYVTEEKL